jgi:hypothetical protein
MLNCRALFLNGPSTPFKSSVSQILSKNLKEAVFLEGDTIVSKENISQAQWLVATVMTGTLKACELAHEGKLPILSFSFRESDWKIVLNLCDHAGVTPVCVTLNSKVDGEVASSFSSLTMGSESGTPEQTSEKIQKFWSELPNELN